MLIIINNNYKKKFFNNTKLKKNLFSMFFVLHILLFFALSFFLLPPLPLLHTFILLQWQILHPLFSFITKYLISILLTIQHLYNKIKISKQFYIKEKYLLLGNKHLIILRVGQNNKALMLYIIMLREILIEYFANILYNVNTKAII